MAVLERPHPLDGRDRKPVDRIAPSRSEQDGLLDLSQRQEFLAWQGIFDRLDVPTEARLQIARRAAANGTPIHAEFLASGLMREEAIYENLAKELGVGFSKSIEAGDLLVSEDDCLALLGRRPGTLAPRLRTEDANCEIAIATDRIPLRQMKALFHDKPEMRERFRVIPRQAMRSALFIRGRAGLQRNAVDSLFANQPEFSARSVVSSWQGYAFGAANALIPLGFVLFPELAWLGLHLISSLFFLACIGLRGIAAATASPNRLAPLERVDVGELPVYSVLVALYKEAEIVPELLVSLGSILWPRSKLEIKLVCEADDRETLAALRAQPLRPWVEIIEVPPVGPRTKPKALAFALPATSGEFVVLYDAEDRPHPAQLVEAWQRFRASPAEVACLQAPLDISNRSHNLITRIFAFEYSALFHGLLPSLARSRVLIPLGGTSNHFRRRVLEEVGGWDPYNVTEDADLGVRLSRFGYRAETITRPTYEPAPIHWNIWVRQRTRWLKGWGQTWLVHMRSPVRLWSEIGPSSFWLTQILFAGLILSAIVHPLMIATLLWLTYNLLAGKAIGPTHSVIFLIDAVNIAFSYVAFLLLGWCTLEKRDRKGFWKTALFTPVYWMAMSLAACRAIWQLWSDPHHWEKTPHYRTETAAPS